MVKEFSFARFQYLSLFYYAFKVSISAWWMIVRYLKVINRICIIINEARLYQGNK